MQVDEDLPHHFLQHEEGDEEVVEYVDESQIDTIEEFVEWEEVNPEDHKEFEHHEYQDHQDQDGVYIEEDVGHYYDEQYVGGYEHHSQEDVAYEDVHPEGYDDYDDTEPSTSYLGRPTVPRKLTIVECEICGAILKHPSKIQAHMRTHTGEKPYECNICGQRFTQRVPMLNHYKRHIGALPYACTYCDKKFPNNSQKTAHELRHQGVHRRGPPRPHLKPPKRRVTAPTVTALPTETMTGKRHPGDEDKASMMEWQPPFGQIHQPLSAAANKRIDDVIEAVVSGTNVRPKKTLDPRSSLIAQCNVCGLMLKHPSKIKAHMRTHTGEKPFGCTVCGMRFATMYPLRMHMKRKHTEDRKIPCTWECGMTFVSIGARNEHERVVHSGVKRYICNATGCHRMFSRRAYLMTHRMKEHPNFQPVFDPHEVTAAEELDQQIDRAVHTEYPAEGVMIDEADVERLIELPDGVFVLPEGSRLYEGEFVEEAQYDAPLEYVTEDQLGPHEFVQMEPLDPEPVAEPIGECKPGTSSIVPKSELEQSIVKSEALPVMVKAEPVVEETVKHVWMNPEGEEKKRKISVRILKRR